MANFLALNANIDRFRQTIAPIMPHEIISSEVPVYFRHSLTYLANYSDEHLSHVTSKCVDAAVDHSAAGSMILGHG